MQIHEQNKEHLAKFKLIQENDPRSNLAQMISFYEKIWIKQDQPHASYNVEEEEAIIREFKAFIGSSSNCFERSHTPGHITGSAIIVSRDLSKVLLTHHKKLNKWLQLGGHADGDTDIAAVALKEAEEESGLSHFEFFNFNMTLDGISNHNIPFDFDRHTIPARKADPEHSHYDVRYILMTDHTVPLTISEESNDLGWFDIDEARLMNTERSMIRQFDKLEFLSRFIS